jgi:quinol monooxygenase YgiN
VGPRLGDLQVRGPHSSETLPNDRRARTMANVLAVVAKIRAAKGKGDALAALLKEQVAAVRKAEPGCLVYRPHRSTKDPDLLIFYEQYKDDAAFEVHRTAPHLAAYRERREEEGLTEGAAAVETYRSITDKAVTRTAWLDA